MKFPAPTGPFLQRGTVPLTHSRDVTARHQCHGHTHKSPLPSQQRGMSLHASEQRLEARTSQSRLHPGVAGDASMKSWAMGTSSDQSEAPRAGAGGCSQAGLGEMPSIPVAKEKMGLSIHPCHTTQRSPRNSTSARTGGRTLPLVMEHKLGINIIKSD